MKILRVLTTEIDGIDPILLAIERLLISGCGGWFGCCRKWKERVEEGVSNPIQQVLCELQIGRRRRP